MTKKRRGWIESNIYSSITRLIPIPTVDLVVVRPDGYFLLEKRMDYPKKGQWWFVGGKVDLGETPEMAAQNIAEREIGKGVRVGKLLGTNTLFFRKGWFGKRSQAIGHTFLARLEGAASICPGEFKWVKGLPPHLVHYYPYISKSGPNH